MSGFTKIIAIIFIIVLITYYCSSIYLDFTLGGESEV
jgi:hypothetical protein